MRTCCRTLVFLCAAVILVSGASSRNKRAADLTAGNWDSCKPGATAPPTRVDTSAWVRLLRQYFATNYIQAYLIPNEDAHQSEYPSEYDKRREFISGFKGSAGYAVITIDKQALWTDGRYFLEAEDTLDCNWILMRQGETGVPTMTEWLKSELIRGNTLGASPFLIGSSNWKTYTEELGKAGISLTPINNELVDSCWNNGRPPQPNTPINVLPLQFAGKSWQDKLTDMRSAMSDEDVDMMVVSSLDETAWLFNLRASDIAYNPFFISYAIVTQNTTTLYLLNHLNKLQMEPTDNETSETVAVHLNTDPSTGDCSGRSGQCVQVKAYAQDDVLTDIRSASLTASKVWLSFTSNFAIYSNIEENKIHQDNTPIATTKTKKNPVEVEGMKNSHIRDAVALISFMSLLEKEVKEGKHWTELSAANELKKYRKEQMFNRGLSFASISGFGSNGAVIHYRPTPVTSKDITTDGVYLLDSGGQYLAQQHNRGLSFNSISGSGSNGAIIHYSVSNVTDKDITTSDMYLLDSGGQYLDGTTDVTRTFHFGTPTAYQKECYTRVLMGQINLFQAIFPRGLYGREIDAFARKALWDVGLVYRHGTGHGIGMYLSVHEGPGRISLSHKPFDRDNILDENQFFSDGPIYFSKSSASLIKQQFSEFQFISDEPGYYQDGEFGIRLENIVMVKNATTQYTFPGTQFLTFEHITLVPYEPNLINYDLLSEKQIMYLNDYHKLCREKVGPELERQGKTAGYEWMMKKSEPVSIPSKQQTSAAAAQQPILYMFSFISLLLCWFD